MRVIGRPTFNVTKSFKLLFTVQRTICSKEASFGVLSKNEELWRMVCQNAWGSETTHALESVPAAKRLGWVRLVRELTTLEAVAWRKFTVGGAVEPSRCKFSACGVGNPQWRHFNVSSPPPGRWGQTLSCLNGSLLVVFGGCGSYGLLNDVFVLDLDSQNPTWCEVPGFAPPLPRSLHSSCILDGCRLSS